MEFVLDVINNLDHISKEHLWLKETLLILQLFIVLALVWW